MKRVLIPWSGGVDSTYLIYKNLKEGNVVRPFSVLLNNNPDQRDREIKSREILSKYFKKKYPDTFQEESLNRNSIEVDSGSNMVLSQPPLWILFSQYSVGFHEIDEIQIGYIMNDDAISYLSEIKNLYDSYAPFTKEKRPDLEFPLTKMKKRDIFNQLPEFIVKNISYCELYNDKKCNCESCKKHKDEINNSQYYHLLQDSVACKEAYKDCVTDSEVEKPIKLQLEFEFSKN